MSKKVEQPWLISRWWCNNSNSSRNSPCNSSNAKCNLTCIWNKEAWVTLWDLLAQAWWLEASRCLPHLKQVCWTKAMGSSSQRNNRWYLCSNYKRKTRWHLNNSNHRWWLNSSSFSNSNWPSKRWWWRWEEQAWEWEETKWWISNRCNSSSWSTRCQVLQAVWVWAWIRETLTNTMQPPQ